MPEFVNTADLADAIMTIPSWIPVPIGLVLRFYISNFSTDLSLIKGGFNLANGENGTLSLLDYAEIFIDPDGESHNIYYIENRESDAYIPFKSIIQYWCQSLSELNSIPGFQYCDGTNGTPNLVNQEKTYGGKKLVYLMAIEEAVTIPMGAIVQCYADSVSIMDEELVGFVRCDGSNNTPNLKSKTMIVNGKHLVYMKAISEIVSAKVCLDTSDATATADDILSGKTAYVNGGKIVGSIPTQVGNTVTPTTEEQTVAIEGTFLTGDIKVAGDANLLPENIVYGESIYGVIGTTAVFPGPFTIVVETEQLTGAIASNVGLFDWNTDYMEITEEDSDDDNPLGYVLTAKHTSINHRATSTVRTPIVTGVLQQITFTTSTYVSGIVRLYFSTDDYVAYYTSGNLKHSIVTSMRRSYTLTNNTFNLYIVPKSTSGLANMYGSNGYGKLVISFA